MSGWRGSSHTTRSQREMPRPLYQTSYPNRVNLREFSDNRTWYPDRVRPTHSIPRAAARLVAMPKRRNIAPLALPSYEVPVRIGYENPSRVTPCIRRYKRKQVMFASGVAGSHGVGRGKPRHLNADSKITCDRS